MLKVTDAHKDPPAAAEKSAATPLPVVLTEKAVAMVLEAMQQQRLPPGTGLRVGVVAGGCSGMQYRLDFAARPTDDDFVYDQQGATVFVDAFSAAHLEGTTIDYVDERGACGFKFNNPNIARSCSCGA